MNIHIKQYIFLIISPFSALANPYEAYITNFGDDTISVIDTTTNTTTATITVGIGPQYLAITPNGLKAYVTNRVGATVNAIDAQTHTVIATISIPPFPPPPSIAFPFHIAITPNGAKAYVTTSARGVAVIDTSNDTLSSSIITSGDTFDVAITPNGAKAYVSHSFLLHHVAVIDTSIDTITTEINIDPLTVGIDPRVIGMMPGGAKVYVICEGFLSINNNIGVIDTSTDTLLTTISVPNGALQDIAFTPDGSKAYITDPGNQFVVVIDTTADTILKHIIFPSGSAPFYVAVSPDGSSAFVSNKANGTVAIIDTTTDTISKTISLGSDPQYVVFTPNGNKIFVPIGNNNVVSIIDATTESVIADPGVGNTPLFVAMTPGIVEPPQNVQGFQTQNRFLTQTDLINVLSWQAPTGGISPAQYAIYRNAALTDLVSTVAANTTLEFADHNRKKGKTYTYYLVAQSLTGDISSSIAVTVTP